MANFRLVDRDTSYLLPPSVDECLPEDHLARFVVEIGDELDISSLEGSYTGSGWDERLADPGPPPKDTTEAEQMAWRLKTPEGRSFYGRRKATVETVFGIIKHAIGFRQFSLRGLRKVA